MSKEPSTMRAGFKNRIVGHENVDPKKLKANTKNWRRHPSRQRQALAGALSEIGWVGAVMVNETTGNIVDGHARVELAIANREPTVPVEYVRLSEEEERKVLATFDPISGMAQTDDAMLAELLAGVTTDDAGLKQLLAELEGGIGDDDGREEPPDVDEQAAAQYQKKWGTAEGQLWTIGPHRLYIGDSTSPKSYSILIPEGRKAQCVYTDPPYGVDYEADSGKFSKIKNDALAGDDLVRFLSMSLRSMSLNAEDDAAHYIWHASSTRKEFTDAMRQIGLIERQYIIWVKPAAVMGWGDYRWQHEPCFYASRDGKEPKYYGDRTETTTWYLKGPVRADQATVVGHGILVSTGAGQALFVTAKPPKNKKYRTVRLLGEQAYLIADEERSDVWEVGRDRMPEHPTEKPVELARRAILNSTLEGDAVLDGFSGSGRMMIAAEQTGRVAFCIEKAPQYCAVTIESMHKLGLKPKLETA